MAGIKVNLTGFEEGAELFRRIHEDFPSIVAKELKDWTDENVSWMQERVKANELDLQPKKRDDGNPPLIDTTLYINSYEADLEGPFSIGVVSKGMNAFMSNQDLAELLEYGWSNGPARPHLRPMINRMRSRAGILGNNIFKSLFTGV